MPNEWKRKACKRGHEYVEGSFSWTVDGNRSCKICERMRRGAKPAPRVSAKDIESFNRSFIKEAAKLRINGG